MQFCCYGQTLNNMFTKAEEANREAMLGGIWGRIFMEVGRWLVCGQALIQLGWSLIQSRDGNSVGKHVVKTAEVSVIDDPGWNWGWQNVTAAWQERVNPLAEQQLLQVWYQGVRYISDELWATWPLAQLWSTVFLEAFCRPGSRNGLDIIYNIYYIIMILYLYMAPHGSNNYPGFQCAWGKKVPRPRYCNDCKYPKSTSGDHFEYNLGAKLGTVSINFRRPFWVFRSIEVVEVRGTNKINVKSPAQIEYTVMSAILQMFEVKAQRQEKPYAQPFWHFLVQVMDSKYRQFILHALKGMGGFRF